MEFSIVLHKKKVECSNKYIIEYVRCTEEIFSQVEMMLIIIDCVSISFYSSLLIII